MTTIATDSPRPMAQPAAAQTVIQTHHLTRYFGRTCALNDVSLAVPRGSVFTLLGRNGSGKSTLVRMLVGLLPPTRGTAQILGEDCQSISPATRGRIGYVAEGHPLIDWMRIGDLAAFQRSFYAGQWDAKAFDSVLDHFALNRRAKAGNLSRGAAGGVVARVGAGEPAGAADYG